MAQGSVFDLRVHSLWLFMANTLILEVSKLPPFIRSVKTGIAYVEFSFEGLHTVKGRKGEQK